MRTGELTCAQAPGSTGRVRDTWCTEKKILLILLLSSFFSSCFPSWFPPLLCCPLSFPLGARYSPSYSPPQLFHTRPNSTFGSVYLSLLSFLFFFWLILSFSSLSCVLSTVETSRTKTPEKDEQHSLTAARFLPWLLFLSKFHPTLFFFFASCTAPHVLTAPTFFLFPSLFLPPPSSKASLNSPLFSFPLLYDPVLPDPSSPLFLTSLFFFFFSLILPPSSLLATHPEGWFLLPFVSWMTGLSFRCDRDPISYCQRDLN